MPARSKSALRPLGVLLSLILLRAPVLQALAQTNTRKTFRIWENGFAILCNWDCDHYSKLSEVYRIEECAFFPGMPFAIRAVNTLIPGVSAETASLITSNALTLLALFLILRLGRAFWPKEERSALGYPPVAWALAFAVSVFPFSQLWAYGYAEPLFVSLVAGALLLAIRKQWILASALIGLTAITRPQGIWISAAFGLFLLWLRMKRNAKISLRTIATCALFCSAPLLAFLAWQWQQTGNPLYFMKLQQEGWHRELGFIHGLIQHVPFIHGGWVWLALSWLAFLRFIRRPEIHWKLLAVFTLVLAELPLFVGGYYSYARFMTANLGLFFLLVELLRNRPIWAIASVCWAIMRLSHEVDNWLSGIWAG